MKKYLNIAIKYAYAAMAGGVFYREFTKYNDFTGVTALGKVHTHLFILGMFTFLIIALFSDKINLESQKSYKRFMLTYNGGVILTAIMLIIRGITQVQSIELTRGASAAISGIAGIGHILTAVGLMTFLYALKKSATK